MGQKTNPIIFRLGKTKKWKSEYFEKKPTEQSVYTFKDLEIKKFVVKSLEEKGLIVHNYKLYYLHDSLHIFVSYFSTFKSLVLVNEINKTQKIKLIVKKSDPKQEKVYRNKLYGIKLRAKNYSNYNKLVHNDILKRFVGKKTVNTAKKIINKERQLLKFRRLKSLQSYKTLLATRKYQIIKNLKINSFLENIFESLTLFTEKKLNIVLTFHQLNKNLKQNFDYKQLNTLKKSLLQLRKYKQNEFFKEGVNLLFTASKNTKSADLIAQFIATYLRKLKRHNFFLKFVQTALILFNKYSFSTTKGIKIKIKGRLNGAPRAKYKIITIGKGVPVLTLDSNLDYSERTAFTANGTIGVKVWTFEY